MDLFDICDDRKPIKFEPWMEPGSGFEFILVTPDNIAEAIDACLQSATGRFALDLETTGIDNRVFEGETKDKIVGVCLSGDGKRGWYIPLRHQKGAEHNIPWTLFDQEFRRLINAVMEDQVVAVFHNGKFDQEFLEFNGGDPFGCWDAPKRWEDTLILAYMRHSRARRKSLKALAATPPDADYTHPTGGPGLGRKMLELEDLFPEDHPKHRYDFARLDPSDRGPLVYACSDAICTWLLGEQLLPAVLKPTAHKFNQEQIYRIEKSCVAATRWMERNRIPTSPEKIKELIQLGQQEWFESVMEVYRAAGQILGRDVTPGYYKVLRDNWVSDDPTNLLPEQVQRAKTLENRYYPNPLGLAETRGKKWPLIYDVNAPKQLGQMFDEMGVPGLRYTDKSQEAAEKGETTNLQIKTSKDELDRVIKAAEDRFPFMKKIKRFRETNKALTNYLFPMLEDADPFDHTIRINFNAHKVDTGRFSTPAKEKELSSAKSKRIAGWPEINFQSIPATYDPKRPACMTRIRECVQARPGYYIVACVAEDSLVPTDRGLIPIQEVKKGDSVLTDEGLMIVGWAGQTGRKPVVRITTTRGFDLRVTPDHLVRTTGSAGFTWKPAGELQPGDWVIQVADPILGGADMALPPAPTPSPWETPVRTPTSLTPLLAEWLGRFMGDGCIGHGHGKIRYIGFALGDDVEDVLPVLNQQSRSLFGVEFSPKTRGDVHKWSQPLARWVNDVTNKGSTTIRDLRVPSVVMRGSATMHSAFLRGLFDADGSVGPRPGDGVSAWITSEQMAREVQLLLLGLGIPASRTPCTRETNFGTADGFSLTITGIRPLEAFECLVGMACPRKNRALTKLIQAGRARDASNFIPLDLARLAVRRQRHPITNRLRNNGRRHGRVTYEMLAACEAYPQDTDAEWLETLLRGSLVFDQVEAVSPDGEAVVYDINVPEGSRFQANGILIHNCDYSGEELRLVTNLSREPKWLDEFFRCSGCDRKFARGDGDRTPKPPPPRCPNCGSDKIGDLHTLTALSIFGQDAIHRADWKQLRGNGKGVNFALCYGGGGNAVVRACKVDKNEGWRIKTQFDATYLGLKQWWGGQHKFAHEHGFVLTAFGRIYPVPDIWSGDGGFRAKAERNSVNGPIQGSGADIIKIAMALVYKECQKRGWLDTCRMIATMHDELVFEIHEDILEEALAVIVPLMTSNPFIMAKRWPVPLTTDCEIGTDWSVPWDINAMRYREVRFDGNKKVKEPSKPKLEDFESATDFEEAVTAWHAAVAAWKAMPHSWPEVLLTKFQNQGPTDGSPPPPPAAPETPTTAPVSQPPEPAASAAPLSVSAEQEQTASRGTVAPASVPVEQDVPRVNGDGVYEYVLRAPLTPKTCVTLAEVIHDCKNSGTRRLRLCLPDGQVLSGWDDHEYLVNDTKFHHIAQHAGL